MQPHHIETAVCSGSDDAKNALGMQTSTFIHRETISEESPTPQNSSQPIVVAKSHQLRPPNVTAGRSSTKESLSSSLRADVFTLSTPVNSSVGHYKRSRSDGTLLSPQVCAAKTLDVSDDHMHTSVSSAIIAVPSPNIRRSKSEGGHLMDLSLKNLPRDSISDQDDGIYDTPKSPPSNPAETPVYSYVSPESFTLLLKESPPDKHAKPDSFHHDLPSLLLLSNGNPSVFCRQTRSSPNQGMSPSDMAAKPEKIAVQRVCSDTSPQIKSITETGQNGTPSPKTVTFGSEYTNLRRSTMNPDWETTYQSTSPCPSRTSSDHVDESVSSPRPDSDYVNSDQFPGCTSPNSHTDQTVSSPRPDSDYVNSDQRPGCTSPNSHTDQTVSSPRPDSDYVNSDQYSHSYMQLQKSSRIKSTNAYQVPDRGQLRKSKDDAVQSHSEQTHQDSAEGVTEQLYASTSDNAGLVGSDAEYDHLKKSPYDHLRKFVN